MTSRRLLKANEAIREVVSIAILTELRDPRDMKSAKVSVSIMGDEKQQKLSLSGLQNAAGFLQQKIAERIDTRYTPRLSFVMDKGVKNSLEVMRILNEVLPKEKAEATDEEAPDEDATDEEVE
jgi:ribosome-binding factor A